MPYLIQPGRQDWEPTLPPAGAPLSLFGRSLHPIDPVGSPLARVSPDSRAWAASGFLVLASLERTHHGPLLHVSFSHRSRDPTWAEIKEIRDQFYPDTVDAMMMLPKTADYVNIHEHCFHLWQCPTEWNIQ